MLLIHLLVFLACLAAAAAFTWPLAAQLSTHLVGEKLLDTQYIGAWLLSAPLSQWLSPELTQLNFPDGGSAALVALPQFLLARALSLVMGDTAAINLSLLLHLAGGGYAGFRLSRRLRGEQGLGLVALAPDLLAGAVFGFSAFALSVMAYGQPENCGLVYVALSAEAAWVAATQRKLRALPVLAVGFAAAFLSTPYLAMSLLLAGWPLGLWVCLRARSKAGVAGVGVVLGITAVLYRHFSSAMDGVDGRLLCPSAMPERVDHATTMAWTDGQLVLGEPDPQASSMVLDPAQLLALNPLTDGTVTMYVGYLGWVGLMLAAVCLWADRRKAGILALCAVGPLVLGLGPHLMVDGLVPLVNGGHLRLPLHFLAQLPLLGGAFEAIQLPARLAPGVLLPLSVAAGLGAAQLLARAGSKAPWLAAVLPLAPLADQLLLGPANPPLHTYPTAPPMAYEALALQAGAGALIDIPPLGYDPQRRAINAAQKVPVPPPVNFMRGLVGAATVHGRPVPYGGCLEQTPFHASAMGSELATVVGDVLVGSEQRGLHDAALRLRSQGYGWLVVHGGTGLMSPDGEQRLLAAAQRDLQLVGHYEDDTWLFQLP